MPINENKRVFEHDGTKYAVMKPNAQQSENASLEYTRVFSKALKSGSLLRETVEKYMREQGLWDDKKNMEYLSYITEINESEKKLQKGGIKLSDAKKIAIEMSIARANLQELIAERNALDSNTAQGQAETARFNYILVNCLVYNEEGNPVYDDIDHFVREQSSPVAVEASQTLANMWYGLDDNYQNNLPENKFLKKWKFVNDDLRLINEKGEFVDTNGRRVNEEGHFIDDDGNPVNFQGEPINPEGGYAFDGEPFLDDDGKEIINSDVAADSDSAKDEPQEDELEAQGDEQEGEEKPKKEPVTEKKKRGRPKKSETKT